MHNRPPEEGENAGTVAVDDVLLREAAEAHAGGGETAESDSNVVDLLEPGDGRDAEGGGQGEGCVCVKWVSKMEGKDDGTSLTHLQ